MFSPDRYPFFGAAFVLGYTIAAGFDVLIGLMRERAEKPDYSFEAVRSVAGPLTETNRLLDKLVDERSVDVNEQEGLLKKIANTLDRSIKLMNDQATQTDAWDQRNLLSSIEDHLRDIERHLRKRWPTYEDED